MGKVIRFPIDGRVVRLGRIKAVAPATVTILPVVRIERYTDVKPAGPRPLPVNGRRRSRRRSSPAETWGR